ncbi:uncharacterized protein CIMG_12746 [Coccidioides immitis RS]|uniref:Uncharacterized protein n=1 Tax=Coccidioides immitis (strain RS) TaxID=246410 RepID=J3KK73_COCIM|nr:uncharacterized protein CIMG_12746 [Coccidioides immitis RS]EAS36550.3 hypothetical protein CIMG_12746 [Coccidioides immitis RS]
MTERGVRIDVYSAVGLSANRTPSARGKFTVGCLYESHSCRGVKDASETPPRTPRPTTVLLRRQQHGLDRVRRQQSDQVPQNPLSPLAAVRS